MSDDARTNRTPFQRYWLGCALSLVSLVVIIMAIPQARVTVDHFLLTGHLFPVDKIDVLQSPVAVRDWSPDGLNLADGQTLPLPGLTRLPEESDLLEAAIGHGVEIAADGRVYGLVKIHHWCGNDPVRNHLAKVDLAHLLLFLGEGEPKSELAEEMFPHRETGQWSEYGWNVSDYCSFLGFVNSLPYERQLLHTSTSRPE